MNISRKILFTLFLCGIILAGIGVGVGFWEFETFSYGGEVLLGKSSNDLKTETMKYELPVGDKEKKIMIYGNWSFEDLTFVEDNKLADGTVCFDLTYHDSIIRPYVMYEDYGKENMQYEGALYIGSQQIKNEMELFFENRTLLLKDLKERKISSYQLAGWEKIVLKANKDTMKQLEY